jgi:hypothetical protein
LCGIFLLRAMLCKCLQFAQAVGRVSSAQDRLISCGTASELRAAETGAQRLVVYSTNAIVAIVRLPMRRPRLRVPC